MARSMSTTTATTRCISLPLSALLLSFSLLFFLPGVVAQASQAPPTTFGDATGSGSSSVTGSVTGTAISGSITPSASGSANATSSSASTTNTADLPSLSGYSVCVLTCFQTAVGQANCSNVIPSDCYCNSSNYTRSLLSCMRSSCPEELATAESLTNQFCAVASTSTSISFSVTSFSSSSSSTRSGGNSTATGASNSAATSDPASTSNAAAGIVGAFGSQGGLVGVSLALAGVVLGAVAVGV